MMASVACGWRRTAGALIVVLYAFCAMLPSASVSSSLQPDPTLCLSMHRHGHADAAAHGHAGETKQKPAHRALADLEKCCGLFVATALAPEFQIVPLGRPQGTAIDVAPAAGLIASLGDRIDRPPRGFLSL